MPHKNSCPICGARVFAWGKLVDDYKVAFLQDGVIVRLDVEVRRCVNCGNVQQFADAPSSPSTNPKPKPKRGE